MGSKRWALGNTRPHRQRDSSPELQSKAKMDNICIYDDSQLQVVWLIQLIIKAQLWASSLWMSSQKHVLVVYLVNILHQLLSCLCQLCVCVCMCLYGQTAQAVILILEASQNNTTWLFLSFRFSQITDNSSLYSVVELGELACTVHWRLEWYPCWNDPCVTGALKGTRFLPPAVSLGRKAVLLLSSFITSSFSTFTLSLMSSLKWRLS